MLHEFCKLRCHHWIAQLRDNGDVLVAVIGGSWNLRDNGEGFKLHLLEWTIGRWGSPDNWPEFCTGWWRNILATR